MNQRLNLALITLDFPPAVGGVQLFLYETIRRIAQHHAVTVITPAGGPLPDDLPFARRVLPGTGVAAFVRALQAVRAERVLVGHAHPRLLLAAALTAPGRYATLTYGNDYLAAQHRWHRPLFNRLLAGSRPLLTITHANAARLRALGLPPPHVIQPGTDPTRFTPAATPPPFPPVLLTVGRLVSRKGIDTVLHALPILRTTFPDLRYRIVGAGPERPQLENLVQRLDLAPCVEFLGPLDAAALPEVYRSAHIFVMPAREEPGSIEGFGIVYTEASAAGLPVVAAHTGGAAEAVRTGETGLLIPPDDPQSLARAVHMLLEEPETRARMGRAGRRWVVEALNWDRATLALLDALKQ